MTYWSIYRAGKQYSGETKSVSVGNGASYKALLLLDKTKIVDTYKVEDADGILTSSHVYKGKMRFGSSGQLVGGNISEFASYAYFDLPKGEGHYRDPAETAKYWRFGEQGYSFEGDVLNMFSRESGPNWESTGASLIGIYNSNSKPDQKYGDWAGDNSPFADIPITNSRDSIASFPESSEYPDGWWNNPFATSTASSQSPLTGTAKKADIFALTGTPEFGADTADRITNFNPKEKDKLQIDVSDFGSNAAGTFKIAKNAMALTKALASTTDFIYLKSTGELYYNENGKLPGYGEGGVFAILENKANITTKNVEFL